MRIYHAMIVVCILLVSSVAFGQTGLTIGAQGGFNIASVSANPEPTGLASRTGLAFGAHAEYALTPLFSVRPEVVFVQGGAKFSGTGFEGTAKFDYLMIPVLAVASFDAGVFTPMVMAGPSLGFNMTAESEVTAGGVTTTTDNKPNTSSTDVALMVGAGAKYGFGPKLDLFIHARYAMGLTDIDTTPTPAQEVKTRGIMFFLGVSLDL